MSDEPSKILIAGLGYIGLPTAALIAKNQLNVSGFDINSQVVDTVNRGEIHIVEPGLADLVQQVVGSGYLKASTEPAKADVFMIAVPTPFTKNNEPDISFVEEVTRRFIPFLEEGNLFIIESTCPVGTTEKMGRLIFSERPELEGKIYIAYCPERVLPGKVIEELEHNDRVIGGIDKASSDIAAKFYTLFVRGELHRTNAKTAEMCKLTENSARDVSIAFANELSIICDKAGINIWELIYLANKHPRINILQPGVGVGGHCIAVDPWFIVSEFPLESKIIRTAREINNYKPLWVLDRIKSVILRYVELHGRKPRVALMGLAFKPDIDDLRESPALYIANEMLHFDKAEVFYVEPNLPSHSPKLAAFGSVLSVREAYDVADVVVFLVAHREFRQLKVDDRKIEMDFCGVRNSLKS
ncbi:MAG: UDP-N-acetyl-D-mannosamine dehydrogenase [Mangrovibacterium sp.]